MKLKYNKKTVLDYICGNDIEDYDIDKLESDYNFMLEVIKHTKDKNIYNLCNDNLKINVLFIKELLLLFHDDIDYCLKISNYFMKNSKEKLDKVEMNIIFSEVFKDKNNDELDTFRRIYYNAHQFYCQKKLEYDIEIKKSNDRDLGVGFWFVLDEFKNHPIIKEYLAKKMFDEIYDEIDLEEYLHNRFKEKQELEQIGIKQYILNSIYGYDECLSGYLSKHNRLIEDVEEKIKKYLANWDNYRAFDYYDMFDVINEFAMNNKGCNNFSTVELIQYIVKELNIEKYIEDIKKYIYDYNQEYYNFTFGYCTLEEQNALLKLKKHILLLIKKKYVPDAYEQDMIKPKSKRNRKK